MMLEMMLNLLNLIRVGALFDVLGVIWVSISSTQMSSTPKPTFPMYVHCITIICANYYLAATCLICPKHQCGVVIVLIT